MAGQSRKWMILVAAIWIQAFTGTNFDFSAYSSNLKSVLGISQVQLNYLATASDLGKIFGWSSGLALLYLPLWSVLILAAFMGFIGYGFQWLLLQNLISLPHFIVFLLCLLSGCSISWFNTVCFVLCNQNFPTSRALALSLTISYNGLSPAIYNLAADAISSPESSIYLILNALFPLITCFSALVPILRQHPLQTLPQDAVRRDSFLFIILNIIAVFTGMYLLLLNSVTAISSTARIIFGGALFFLVLPLCIPGIVYARSWALENIHASFRLQGSGFNLVDVDDLELHKELLIGREEYYYKNIVNGTMKNQLSVLGEEHSARDLLSRLDFWLYYVAYFCGGTIGLVYSNNLGQISQSLGFASKTTELLTLYSSCSFFGRLLSAAPDFLCVKLYFARTGWLAIALLPTPVAFFLLTVSSSERALEVGTALIGFSSGFIFAAAVSITSELFGPNSMGINHNILITNIPIGSLAYGLLAAIVYDSNVKSSGLSTNMEIVDGVSICMGRQCYLQTFLWWGVISLFGLLSSGILFVRTKPAYDRFEENRILTSDTVYLMM
ncbi:protein NUCLEAR FUSION DEFECTIVE 4-like isoform X1 [Papaver somniferum]|uniref:protein NUCLEAR FUSION DEFECTIVE 4-like isoform X1 n=1 Tax=Papaver somniferum TaxID=3469 RepID=UPI000E6F82BB|nr:protein NUCLEAR FUSION DEFECTIVE 4-like isoform X1 [Papaver somniferum]